MARRYGSSADFAIVYLEEAHSTDGWMYGEVQHLIAQHTQLSQRRAAAGILFDVLEKVHGVGPDTVPLCVDLMDNRAALTFGALPERLVVLRDGQVEWIGGKGPMEYSVDEMTDALEALLAAR